MLRSGDIGATTVVADLEAGLGTLTRLGAAPIEVVVLVVEPSAKSVEVARRAAAMLRSRPVGRLVAVANKATGAEDGERLRAAMADLATDLVVVPDDPAVRAADREGVSPLDAAPDSPAVQALVGLGRSLLPAGRA